MTEPDWSKHRVAKWDPEGVKQRKLLAFMDDFIEWRLTLKEADEWGLDPAQLPVRRKLLKTESTKRKRKHKRN